MGLKHFSKTRKAFVLPRPRDSDSIWNLRRQRCKNQVRDSSLRKRPQGRHSKPLQRSLRRGFRLPRRKQGRGKSRFLKNPPREFLKLLLENLFRRQDKEPHRSKGSLDRRKIARDRVTISQDSKIWGISRPGDSARRNRRGDRARTSPGVPRIIRRITASPAEKMAGNPAFWTALEENRGTGTGSLLPDRESSGIARNAEPMAAEVVQAAEEVASIALTPQEEISALIPAEEMISALIPAEAASTGTAA